MRRVRMKIRSSIRLAELMRRNPTGVAYSVRTLAETVGCGRSTIGALRSGEPGVRVDRELAEQIAAALGVGVEELFREVAYEVGAVS